MELQNAGCFEWSDVALLLDFLESARISETARKLQLDETTVVRRLKRLQSALDVPLIETRDNRLIATEAALALRGKAEMMFEAAAQFQRASAGSMRDRPAWCGSPRCDRCCGTSSCPACRSFKPSRRISSSI